MADQMMTSSMTSRDHESQGRDPNVFKAHISNTAQYRDLVTMGHL